MEPNLGLTTEERFKVIHEEIHREHGLISNRTNWYVTCQPFLVAAFGLCGQKDYQFMWMGWFIPVIGIGTTLLVLASIIAGLLAMRRRRHDEFAISKGFKDPKLLHWLGMSPALGIPAILLWAWVYCLRH